MTERAQPWVSLKPGLKSCFKKSAFKDLCHLLAEHPCVGFFITLNPSFLFFKRQLVIPTSPADVQIRCDAQHVLSVKV